MKLEIGSASGVCRIARDMTMSFCFVPSQNQGERCDAAMRRGLGESLEYLCDTARDHLEFDEAAVRRIAADLRGGSRYPGSTFGIYYELVPALGSGNRQLAESLFAELATQWPLREDCRILSLGSPELGADPGRYVRLLNTDPGQGFDFDPPPEDVARKFTASLQSGRRLLRQAIPELAGEQEAIISELILAAGGEESGPTFDGGSSYMLWGALFLNAQLSKTDVGIVEALAHEAGHSLLFGLCTEEALVNNPDSDRFESPLRQDARPMDGIYHATFVSARMHWTMARLCDSDCLAPEQKAEAESRRDESRRSFENGYETVAAHGEPTTRGAEIMQATREYMDST